LNARSKTDCRYRFSTKGGKILIKSLGPVAETALAKAAKKFVRNEFGGARLPKFVIGNKQFSVKASEHMPDFNLDITKATDRAKFRGIIEDIVSDYDISISGDFIGQAVGGSGRGPVQFLIKGTDVVMTKPNGVFISILKDGANTNPSVIAALNKAGITP